MKIVQLTAENIKKLVAVEIKPDGAMVQITGANGQGKTSVLDCILWALNGAQNIQLVPVRQGEEQGRIRLDLGELVVTRKFVVKEDGDYTTSLTVESADGAKFNSPQTVIDKLLGTLSFDPLAFARMEPAKQFEMLRQFVPGVDFPAIDAENKKDYDERTVANRKAKEFKTLAEAIKVEAGPAPERVDEKALVDELAKAGEHNTALETRRANRNKVADAVELNRSKASEVVLAAKKALEEAEKEATRLLALAEQDSKKLADAGPLPATIDTAAILKKIEDAKVANARAAAHEERAAHEKAAKDHADKAAEITARMEKRQADKLAAIAAANLPVKGLEFGDGIVLYKGVPFDQASDAQQLGASLSLAMALNPKLRVIRVRDGSLLDETSLAIVEKMAAENDYQVWIERVETSGKVGFVIENGSVKGVTQ